MSRLLKNLFLLALCAGLTLGLTFNEAVAQQGTCQDKSQDSTIDAAGNIVILGESTYAGYWRAIIVKYDALGNFLWAVKQPNEAVPDSTAALAVDLAGNIYVTGTRISIPRMWITQKYSPAGVFQWERTFIDPGYETYGIDLATDSLGNIYVAGILRSDTSPDHEEARVLKYSTDGVLLWSVPYGEQYLACHPIKMVIDSLDNVYVVGSSRLVSTIIFCTLHKFSSDGVLQWAASYDNPQNTHDIGCDIVIDSQGDVYVAGMSNTGTSAASMTLKYDANGNLLWARSYEKAALYYIAINSSGDICVGGAIDPDLFENYLFMAKYNSYGEELWTAIYQGSQGCLTLALDSSGNLYVGTDRWSQGTCDIKVIKYDPEGNLLFAKQFISPDGQDYPYDIFVDSTGDIRVAGYGYKYQTDYDLLYLKYDAVGNLIFVRWYDAAVGDIPNHPPIANAGPNLTLIVCESGQFNGSGSCDPDGSIASYQWDFGDETTAAGIQVSRAFKTAGVFTATLTVTDNFGATATDTAMVTVKSLAGAIQVLIDLVASFNIQQGINNSLDTKLQRAREALDAVNANQRQDAQAHIEAFINEVNAQRGKALTEAQADQLLYWALRINSVIIQPAC